MNLANYSKEIIRYLYNCKTARNSTVFRGKTYEHTVKRELVFKLFPFCNTEALNLLTLDSSTNGHLLDGYVKDDNYSLGNYSKLVSFYNEQIKVVGQAFDKGVDIVGPLDNKIVVLVQCKNYKMKKITGKDIRECVGITSLYKTTNYQQESLTIIASPSGITNDAIEDMNKFPLNLLYAQISDLHVPADGSLSKTIQDPNMLLKLSQSGQLISFVENKKCFQTFGFAKNTFI
ncbi:hypothetical protein QEN19_000377 [Hanseniaspora menglaensis]